MTEKTRLRAEARERRDRERDGDVKSAAILSRLEALPEFECATTLAIFVGVGSEVRTLPAIERALARGVRVAVPCVEGSELGLFLLATTSDLAPAPFGLLEPPSAIREIAGRNIPADAVDIFVVPGLAFDRMGGRIGYGRGYYDRLLRRASPQARFVAVAYESQVVERVPMHDADVPMHRIVTEAVVHTIVPVQGGSR